MFWLVCCCRLNGKSIKAVAAVMDLPATDEKNDRKSYVVFSNVISGYMIQFQHVLTHRGRVTHTNLPINNVIIGSDNDMLPLG